MARSGWDGSRPAGRFRFRRHYSSVMPGLVPGIHVLLGWQHLVSKTWMAGTEASEACCSSNVYARP